MNWTTNVSGNLPQVFGEGAAAGNRLLDVVKRLPAPLGATASSINQAASGTRKLSDASSAATVSLNREAEAVDRAARAYFNLGNAAASARRQAQRIQALDPFQSGNPSRFTSYTRVVGPTLPLWKVAGAYRDARQGPVYDPVRAGGFLNYTRTVGPKSQADYFDEMMAANRSVGSGGIRNRSGLYGFGPRPPDPPPGPGGLFGSGLFKGGIGLPSLSTLFIGRAVANAAFGAAENAGRNTADFLRYGIEQTSEKRGQVAGFGAYLGSATAGRQFYGDLQRFNDVSPLEQGAIGQAGLKFLGAGLGRGTSLTLIKAASDLVSSANVKPGQFNSVTDLVSRAVTSPQSLTNRSYSILSRETGGFVNQKSLAEALQRSRGITFQQATAALKNTAPEFAQNFLDALVARAQEKNLAFTGSRELGGSSRLFGLESTTGLLSTSLDRLKESFRDVNLRPLNDFLTHLNESTAIGTPLMDQFKTSVNDLFQNVLQPWTEDLKSGKLETALAGVAGLLKDVGAAAVVASSLLNYALTKLGGNTDQGRAGGYSGILGGIGVGALGAIGGAGLGSEIGTGAGVIATVLTGGAAAPLIPALGVAGGALGGLGGALGGAYGGATAAGALGEGAYSISATGGLGPIPGSLAPGQMPLGFDSSRPSAPSLSSQPSDYVITSEGYKRVGHYATGGGPFSSPTLAVIGDAPGHDEYVLRDDQIAAMRGGGAGITVYMPVTIIGSNISEDARSELDRVVYETVVNALERAATQTGMGLG